MKICGKCKIDKEKEDFSNSQFKLGQGWCKLCIGQYNKEHYTNNKTYHANRSKVYRENNREKVKEISKNYMDSTGYNKKYREENKEILRIKKNKYLKDRYKTDPSFRIKVNIYQRISKTFKHGINKTLSKALPYSFNELKQHLESLFEPWMNWDNWKRYSSKTWDDNNQSTWTWQIDHIIPHSKLKYSSTEDDNFKKCWALSNLRPYPSKNNIIDGNRR